MTSALTLEQIGRVRRALRPLAARYPSQAALARALDVSPSTAADVLSGAELPGHKVTCGVARLLGTTASALLSTPSAELAQALTRAA